jgi:hypothetical protein
MNIFLLAAASNTPVNANNFSPLPEQNSSGVLWAVAAVCLAIVLYIVVDAWVVWIRRRRFEKWRRMANNDYTFIPSETEDASHGDRGPTT